MPFPLLTAPAARVRAACRSSSAVALLLALSAASLAAQQQRSSRPAGPLWDSYERAAAVLRQALAAHGGADVVRGITAASFRWEGEEFAPTQGRVPSAAWDTAGNGRVAVQEVRVDYARNRYQFDREFRFPGGYLNAIRVVADGRVLLAYNPYPDRGMGGTEYQRDTAGTAARRNMTALAAAMPPLLLRMAAARASTLRWLGETSDGGGGRREQAVSFATADGDPITLYFDADSHLLTRSEEMGPGSLGDEVDARLFSDYRTEAGLAVPHRMDVRWNGLLTGTHRLTRFATAADLGDSVTKLPDGYVASAAAPPPAMERVADGVYYVERLGGGYRMLVVDTDDGVVVVDAPLSPPVADAAIALIGKTLPGRPIRWVALTHHHGDHIGGVPAFAARGATVLVAPGSEEYVRRASTVTRTIGQLGVTPSAPPAAPTIEPVRGRRTIGRGARTVQVLDVSPTSHAASMLAVWVPSAKLLFQGDLLRINEHGGPVVSPEATRDLDRIIRRFGLDVRAIGAVHGANGTIDDLRAALRKGQ